MSNRILAWHFTDGLRLRDGTPLEVGKTYHYEGELKLCQSGYHYSESIIHALRYAPGLQVSRVEVWDIGETESDKGVARNRRVLWTLDATNSVLLWVAECADHAMRRTGWTDERSWAATRAVRAFVAGEIGKTELTAIARAAYAAYAAARAAYAAYAANAADAAAAYAAAYAAYAACAAASYAAYAALAADAADAAYAAYAAACAAASYAAADAAQDRLLRVLVNKQARKEGLI